MLNKLCRWLKHSKLIRLFTPSLNLSPDDIRPAPPNPVEVYNEDVKAFPCQFCHQSGKDRFKTGPCRVCHGQGTVERSLKKPTDCKHCHGRGVEPYHSKQCKVCGGSGVIETKEESLQKSQIPIVYLDSEKTKEHQEIHVQNNVPESKKEQES